MFPGDWLPETPACQATVRYWLATRIPLLAPDHHAHVAAVPRFPASLLGGRLHPLMQFPQFLLQVGQIGQGPLGFFDAATLCTRFIAFAFSQLSESGTLFPCRCSQTRATMQKINWTSPRIAPVKLIRS